MAFTHKQRLMVGARGFTGNLYDGYTLNEQLEQVKILTEDTAIKPKQVVVDLGSGAWMLTTLAFRSFTGASSRA